MTILRFAKKFFAGTAMSRIFGLLREMTMAFCFGSTPQVASFMVAYRFANLFRRLVGEGSVQAGFVPYFSSIEGEKSALLFYRDVVFSFLLLVLGITLLCEGVFWVISGSSSWQDVASFAMWMVPSLLFLSLYSLNSALLQCRKEFFVPAIAPVFFSLSWMGVALLVRDLPSQDALLLLSVGVVLAFGVQWLCTAIWVRKEVKKLLSWKEWFSPTLFSPQVRSLLRSLSLGTLGMGAVQINSALDAIFARLVDPSGPAYLWYAIRIEQLPVALFGIAIAGALLPLLSQCLKEDAWVRYTHLLQQGLVHGVALMIPCACFLGALAGQSVDLLFGHGKFSPLDVAETTKCLQAYAPALLGSVWTMLLASGFYAKKEFGYPTIASVLSVLCNVTLNGIAVLFFSKSTWLIALSTSIASCLNGAILFGFLRKKRGFTLPEGFGKEVLSLSLAGGGAYLATKAFTLQAVLEGTSSFDKLLVVGWDAFLFGATFVLGSYLLRGRAFFALFRADS